MTDWAIIYASISFFCGLVTTVVAMLCQEQLEWGYRECFKSAVAGVFVAALWRFALVGILLFLIAVGMRQLQRFVDRSCGMNSDG